METRRGKYWESDPERLRKAEEKRERRRERNLRQILREHWQVMFPDFSRHDTP